MKTFAVLTALILGLSLTQVPEPTNQNYCNAPGVFCRKCTQQGTNKSCDSCARMFISSPVPGLTKTNQCVPVEIPNCINADSATVCDDCAPGFSKLIKKSGPAVCIPDNI